MWVCVKTVLTRGTGAREPKDRGGVAGEGNARILDVGVVWSLVVTSYDS